MMKGEIKMGLEYILYGLGNCFEENLKDGNIINRLENMGYHLMGLSDGKLSGKIIKIDDREYRIISPQDLLTFKYDKIVLTIASYELYDEIKKSLELIGVDIGKISCLIDFLRESFYEGNYDYSLAAVCIVKQEEKNIYEWIEYHRLKGIEHFYIYDNGESTELAELLQPYIEKRIVDLIVYPGEAKQLSAYRHAVEHYSMKSKYMAFIDADEFIYTKKETLQSCIDRIMCNSKDALKHIKYLPGGIGINWRLFGTSGYKERSYDLVTASHFRRSKDEFIEENGHIKTIANPRCITRTDCHYMKYLPFFKTISPLGSIIEGPFFPDGTREQEMRIYHYAYKSEEEIKVKYLRGNALSLSLAQKTSKLIYNALEMDRHYLNEVYDNVMAQYEHELIERINNIYTGGK